MSSANPQKDLEKALRDLSERINKANALKAVFLRGLVSGLATALGATVIAGVVIWILYNVFAGLDLFPMVQEILQSTARL